ncbi:MAG: NYN domain-containing protein [Gloeotrichia echinulata IR180]|jgi:uncharacterized LabA/DUF88 family protein|nr:NYN domain-containing protein [Gloeotrichia echinulata DEX184]
MTISPFSKEKNEDKRLSQKPHWQRPILMKNNMGGEGTKKPNPVNYSAIFEGIHRGRIAIFIDGLSLFQAASQLGIEIDYLKFLCCLTDSSRLLRAFFYTITDISRPPSTRLRSHEKQQGFLFWMRRNGYRVVTKEFSAVDNSKKPNLNVEIAVDMITLSPYYDTAILVSGDGDLAYAVNAVTSKGARVEVVSLRTMTSDSLIDVADYFIDLDSIKKYIQKDSTVGYNYRTLSNSSV